jgi:hypothetical protein
VIGRGGERGQDCGQQESQPFEQRRGRRWRRRRGFRRGGFGPCGAPPSRGLDGGTAAQLAFDGLGDAASLAGDIDPELVTGRGVVAAIAAAGDDAGKARADHLRRRRGNEQDRNLLRSWPCAGSPPSGTREHPARIVAGKASRISPQPMMALSVHSASFALRWSSWRPLTPWLGWARALSNRALARRLSFDVHPFDASPD